MYSIHRETHVQQRNSCTHIWCVHAYIMSTVAATTGPRLSVMTEIDNKVTNNNTTWKSYILKPSITVEREGFPLQTQLSI